MKAPALLLRNRHEPPISSGVPMRFSGTLAIISLPNLSKVAAIIFVWKGPQANVFDLPVVLSTKLLYDVQRGHLRDISLPQVVRKHPT